MFTNNISETAVKRTVEAGKTALLTVKPRVDIFENENSVKVLLEMPNVNKSDLSLKAENGLLHISGKRTTEATGGEFILRETRDVKYERIFELEKSLDADKISAKYEAGILSVTIEKKEKALPRVIEIN